VLLGARSPSARGLARGGIFGNAVLPRVRFATTGWVVRGTLAPSVRPAAALTTAARAAVSAPAPKIVTRRTRLTRFRAASRSRWATARLGFCPGYAGLLTFFNLP
jgi:hypothetical protein